MCLFFPEWFECRISQWADINRQSWRVRRCVAKTQDDSPLTSKMIIALADSITTFGFELFLWELLQDKLKGRDILWAHRLGDREGMAKMCLL